MVLVADIGGTKSNFALCKKENEKILIVDEKEIKSQDYHDFVSLLDDLSSMLNLKEVEALCFAIAGPVINGNCKTTNLPFDIKTEDLKEYFKTEKVKLLNDLEATAYGMLYLDESEFVDLNKDGVKTDGNIAVIAAGTGLGEAILYFDGNDYHPIATEGGHCDFAPINKEQEKFLSWLNKKYPAHVSYERVLSGPGVYTTYEFLRDSNLAEESLKMKNIDENFDKSAMVSKLAFEDNDKLSLEALRLFSEIYGAEAGNLALKTFSIGGVYIGGGIAPKILKALENGSFMNSFLKKGRFESLLKNMKVRISLNQKTAVVGASNYIFDKLI